MLLHEQSSKWHLDEKQTKDLTDMILVAINEVTKVDDDENRYDVGVDFTNITIANPYVISNILQNQLGYEEEEMDTNGWQLDYWQKFTHDSLPAMQLSGTGITHTCELHGCEEDTEEYELLENNPKYTERIKHGIELINAAPNFPCKK